MDIKQLMNTAVPTAPNAKKADAPKRKEVKSESTTDRDANGQSFYGGQNQRRKMTKEELEKAVNAVKEIPGFQDSGLVVQLKSINEKTFVLVEDPEGKVVRRIPEQDLWSLLVKTESESGTGQLLNKAM